MIQWQHETLLKQPFTIFVTFYVVPFDAMIAPHNVSAQIQSTKLEINLFKYYIDRANLDSNNAMSS